MDTPLRLAGKTILITGASSGIGKQAAIDCAQSGATVIISGRSVLKLEETLSALTGVGHDIVVCDLMEEAEIAALVAKVPILNGVVHCAGTVKPFPVQFLTKQKIDETLHANFYTTVCLTASLFKAKKISPGASLVFLSSISGQRPARGNSMYAASKAAIEAFAKTVAAEYAEKKIRANCISPAMVKTPMYDNSANGEFEATMEQHVAQYPLGVGHPADVSHAIIFLLSQEARWITGTNIVMDGGFFVNR